jgi:pSer/pThr/pTyr-binding forkhead associated (FHA) protein
MLFDNDSHNGVFLNGVKIHSAVLRDGDVVQVADSIFIYSES